MVLNMATTTPPVDLVSPLLGTQSCSPLVGVPLCRMCGGAGEVAEHTWEHRDPRVTECPNCDGCGYALSDSRIEALLAQALRSEDVELVVACESALTMIQREETRRAALFEIAELLSKRGEVAA